MKHFPSLLAGALLGAVMLTALAASVKISDLPLSTSPSTNTFIEIADMDAGTKSLKYLLTNVVTASQVSLYQQFGNSSIGLGTNAWSGATIDNTSYALHGVGYFAGRATGITNTYDVHFEGRQAGAISAILDAADIFFYGNYAGYGSKVDTASNLYFAGHSSGQLSTNLGSGNVFYYGNESGLQTTLSNSFDVMALNGALKQATITDSESVVGIGKDAGSSVTGAYTNVTFIGAGSTLGATGKDTVAFTPGMNLVGLGSIALGGETRTNWSSPITNWVYVAANGDDGTAIRYDASHPFATISAAMVAAQAGDVVYVGPGYYTNTTPLVVKPNVTLRGVNPQLTFITGAFPINTTGCILVPANNSVIEDLAVISYNHTATSAPIGSSSHAIPAQQTFTNAVIRNVWTDADSDGFYIDQDSPCSVLVDNCNFNSRWDTIAWTGNTTNHVITVRNSKLVTMGPTTLDTSFTNTARSINGLNGYGRFENCTIVCSNGVYNTHAIEARNAGCFIDLINTPIWAGTSSTGLVYKVANTNGVVRIFNPTIAATDHTGTLTRMGYTAPTFVTPPVTLTDAATVATDASLSSHFIVTLGGNRTLGNPTNPTDGQRIIWEVIQDATGSRTLAMDTKFAFGSDITSITLTTTASKRDFITAVYDLAADKWYVTGFVRGY